MSASKPFAIYLRVSTDEQRERQSIVTQHDFAERFCALHELPIYGWYPDDGVSGTVPLELRPEGARLLQDAREQRFGTLLIYRLDRLGRDPRLILNAVNDLEVLGIQVRSMTEPFDTSSPAGRFMLTTLSAVAGFERESIIQRSVEGTNRLAREGAWLGGIVPYGYQVMGKNREARLVVSEQIIPGANLSEADVVRLIYRLLVEEDKSCMAIADHLNALGVPPVYSRDERQLLRGKRREATSGIWRGGRIRNLVVNTTYKGIHRYGQRTKKVREIIEREVPAIVSVETWERAQQMLRKHIIFAARNSRRQYLLRGLIKCGECGLTYVGNRTTTTKGRTWTYYTCSGKTAARGLYGAQGKRCPSKSVSAEDLEHTIWHDIESFLQDPGLVLRQLTERMQKQVDQMAQLRANVARFQQQLRAKQGEKDTVVSLFRRERIDAATLDRQLDQVQREEAQLRESIAHVQAEIYAVQHAEDILHSAEKMLLGLKDKLNQPMTWELQRQLVEALIEKIQVNTFTDEEENLHCEAEVVYHFGVRPTLTLIKGQVR